MDNNISDGDRDCGCDREAARVGLNLRLREVVLATQAVEHADCFLLPVDVLDQVTDYHSFVDPRSGTVCLEQLLSRTRSCYYISSQEFRREYEQLLANALAYNSPGHGKHAHRPIIVWAQALLDACVAELARRQPELASFEMRLKECSREDSSGKGSGQASPRSNKMSTSTACPLSSMEALVAACEFAAEQDGMEEDDMQHYYHDVLAAGSTEPVPEEEGTGEAGSGSGTFASGDCDQLLITRLKRQGSAGDGCGPTVGGARGKTAGGRPAAVALDTAPKYRRHKSKVYIRPNKVVYLPTTFMEENFDPSSLPLNCEMIVDTNGGVQPDRHRVTIKAVPRQGLATMYCMTNVMKFQQQFLNWQILNWTKIDDKHIKIHLQSPNGGTKGGRADSDDADAPAAPAPCRHESNKRKGGTRGRVAYELDATDGQVEDAMDMDPAAVMTEEMLEANRQLAAATGCQDHHLQQRHGRAATAMPHRNARGAHRRGAAKAPSITPEGSGGDGSGGNGGELGSASNIPYHQETCDGQRSGEELAMMVGHGASGSDAQCSGSAEDKHREWDAGSIGRGAGGSGGSAEGAAQRSHELELSPAHSGGRDSDGTAAALQHNPGSGQAGLQKVEQQAEQQQQQQLEVQQAQQAPMQHVWQQQFPAGLHLPYPPGIPVGPPAVGFGAWPLCGLGVMPPVPPLMMPSTGLEATNASRTLPRSSGTYEDAQQHYQRYATAMMLLHQLPATAAPPPPPMAALTGASPAVMGCLPIPPLRTSLFGAASLPAGASGGAGDMHGSMLPPAPSAYKRCKTNGGSCIEAISKGPFGAAPAGLLPACMPVPGSAPRSAVSGPDLELSCMSMPGLLGPEGLAMTAAAGQDEASLGGRGKVQEGMAASRLQHALTM